MKNYYSFLIRVSLQSTIRLTATVISSSNEEKSFSKSMKNYDANVVSAKSVLNCQFCTFKDASVEPKVLRAQNFVCRKWACQCFVMSISIRTPTQPPHEKMGKNNAKSDLLALYPEYTTAYTL